MIGAIAGDIIGSVYERNPVRAVDFPLFSAESRFTDDTVLTVALADCLLSGGTYESYMRSYAKLYPDAGFSEATLARLTTRQTCYPASFGNGAAMRVSPLGWAFDDERTIRVQAALSAIPTHGHPLAIQWAQMVALGVFWARKGVPGPEIGKRIEKETGIKVDTPVDAVRPDYRFDATAQGSVPQAVGAFLEADCYESAVRLAVSLGGDADTQACIAGALAEAFFGGVPQYINVETRKRLPQDFIEVIDAFDATFV